jgi:tRNA A-37 threonylcarbamoyl transferase component Bud32
LIPPASLLALREHVEQHPEDHAARLRLFDLLQAQGEQAAARRVLAPLADADGPERRAVLVRLAALEEDAGEALAAATHWEALLADDIDDDEAWLHLERLRAVTPALAPAPAGEVPAAAPTLDSGQGVNVSRYEIVREIGRGASATVYLARERLLGLDLALKVLHPHLAAPGRAEARARFFREARTAAALRHPGVVAIYDVDEQARTLVMEYLAGGTLRERLRHPPSGPGLPAAEVRALARSLLEALAYVHERGVIHGDLTPRNILLRAPGAAVLADFGIARLQEGDAAGLEAPAGTPPYLAPEQFRGAPGSPATDLFAAGAVLWEALAGRPMREHADLAAERFAPHPLPAPAAAAARQEPGLLAVVAWLTEVTPGARPPSARAALERLGPVAR